MTKSLLVAALSAAVGLSASANSDHYPDVKSSSANTNSATSNRVQDPTNPAGAYDTDKSGYANRWNAEDRISAQPHDQSYLHARSDLNNRDDQYVDHSMDRSNDPSIDRDSDRTIHSRTDKGMYQGAYTGMSRDKDTDQYSGMNGERPRKFHELDHTTVNTASAPMSHETSNTMVKDTTVKESSDVNYQADNSGLNQRDRTEQANTADHQAKKGMKSDVELTRKIRRELTKDDSLSTYGKNVKIISQGGEVTLRGPVNTSEEKSKIEDVAERIVGTHKVRNELEIKH